MRKKTHKMKLVSLSFLLAVFFIGMIFLNDKTIDEISNDENNVKDDNIYDIIDDDDEIDLPVNPKSSGTLTSHDPIHINGNWTDALIQGICTGLGTYSYPYIIEDLEIDAGSSGSGIFIENSDEYVIIQNCKVKNSGTAAYDAGIKLKYTNNTQIINCNSSNNGNFGILVQAYCYDNDIIGCRLIDNTDYGIYSLGYDGTDKYNSNIRIKNNTVDNSGNYGIYVNRNYFSTVTGNTATNHPRYGIYFFSGYNHTVSDNTIKSNNWNGIHVSSLINITISDNEIISNSLSGGYSGIYFNSVDDSTISDNNISANSGNGIRIYNSAEDNKITRNIIKDNSDIGLFVDASSCANNDIYRNYFDNDVNAYDTGTSTSWDVGSVGNSWNNYSGSDSNLDGIGDSAHSFPTVTDNNPIHGEALHDGGPIEIEGTVSSGYRSWQYISTRIWCHGSGSSGDPYVIRNLEVAGDQNTIGINVSENPTKYFRIENCHVYNSSDDVIQYSAGILFSDVDYGAIIDCNVSDNGKHIGGNNYGDGILFRDNCRFNTISGTIVDDNNYHGIEFIGGNNNILTNNKIRDNVEYGIYLASNVIANNISYNTMTGNDMCARLLGTNTNNNNFWGNTFGKSSGASSKGVYIGSSCNDNIFWDNYFTGNTLYHVSNNDIDTHFNSSTTGNYWDDYKYNVTARGFVAEDANDDGIGDVNYTTEGDFPGTDNYPIYDDGNNGTKIAIDGDGSSGMTWDYAVTRSWCSGSGTETDPYIIENLYIDGGGTSGICLLIRDSEEIFVVRNCTLTNCGTASTNAGVYLYLAHNGTFAYNNISYNENGGIVLENSDNHKFYRNDINNNEYFTGSHRGGLVIKHSSDHNLILENNINNNELDGIRFDSTTSPTRTWNNIIRNNITYNGEQGIYLFAAICNNISANNISRNGVSLSSASGIYMYNDNIYNTISYNVIDNNPYYGIRITDVSNMYNLIFYNNFTNKGTAHGYDGTDSASSYNEWDNGEIGNYWDDYYSAQGGKDTDDDAIGDSAYNVIGDASNDNDDKPIWWDAPEVSITSPPGGTFRNPPNFVISIDEGVADSRWYSTTNGATQWGVAAGDTGTIDANAWSPHPSGWLSLRFFINDSRGWEAMSTNVMIQKDTDPPTLSFTTPDPFDVFGYTPPSFTANINDLHSSRDTTWYTIIGGSKNVTFDYASQPVDVDPDLWLEFSDGPFTLRIYANDTFNNWDYEDIILEKDITDPDVTIVSPGDGDLFGTTEPPITLNINELNQNITEYEMDDGVSPTGNYSWSGSIDEGLWDGMENGTVTIKFHHHDEGENVGSDEVTVRRDIYAPQVVIDYPGQNSYNNTKPNIKVTATDPSQVDKIWYEHGATATVKPLVSGAPEALLDAVWDYYGSEAQIQLTIKANDTAGNLDTSILTFYKDEYGPRVMINSPGNNTSWNSKPWIEIGANDPYLDSVWYEYGSTKYPLTNGLGEDLDDGIWTSLLPEQQFDIYIYANDSAGNLNNTFYLSLYKDEVNPQVVVNLPEDGTYWNARPYINVTYYDPYGDNLWYQTWSGLGGWGDNVSLTNNTNQQLDVTSWNQLTDWGAFKIYFYANDSAGNINNTLTLDLHKDIEAPQVIYFDPANSSLHGKWAPQIHIETSDYSPDSYWYTLYNISNSYLTSEYTWTPDYDYIDQQVWDAIGNGTNFLINISFYINDTAGNLWTKNVTVWKDTTAPLINIIDPITDDLFAFDIPQCDFDISGTNLEKYWHQLYHESTGWGDNSSTTDAQELLYNDIPINSGLWNAVPNGTVTIRFYVNNSNSVLHYDDVVIRKDIIEPDITVISPDPITKQKFSSPPDFELYIIEGNLNTTWYRLYSPSTGWTENRTFVGNTTIASDLWGIVDLGDIIIDFNVNDTMGNWNHIEVTVEKIAPPVVLPPSGGDDGGGGGGGDDDDTGMPWYLQAAIGGIISASAGIIIKQSFSSAKKRRLLMKGMRDVFSRVPNKEAFLKEKLGSNKWKKLEHVFTQFNNNQINDKDFLKEGKKALGRDFINLFTAPKTPKRKKKLL